ncbi:MAG: spore photoproduct lyase family protein [Chitinophagaceae bacterium]
MELFHTSDEINGTITRSQGIVSGQKRWMPRRVTFTPDAYVQPYGKEIYERVTQLNLPVEILKNNRLTGVRGATEKETYKLAKSTLAIVNAPPSAFKLRPIPPSADWQYNLAEGCPAHCQYCYLAGSLSGPPVIRVFANLPDILQNLANYERPGQLTSYEASCYTDPLGIEHLTGGLAASIKYFAGRPDSRLRYVSKFDAVESLLGIDHQGHTRCRVSLNAGPISTRLEGGTSRIDERLNAIRKLALPVDRGGGSYPVGVVIAPIMPIPNWQEEYSLLLNKLQLSLDFTCDLTFELITHRFTPGSKEVLLGWYPNTSLEMDEANRTTKQNKFGGTKYVYPKEMMRSLKDFFEHEIGTRFPKASILYWT